MPQRKILFITNRVPYPLKDGGNLAMNAMIEGYYREGWQVYLLAMNTTRHFVKHEQLNKLYPGIHRFEWVDINNDVRPIKVVKNFLFSRKPEHVERFYQPQFEHRVIQVLKNFQPDVIQVESVYLTSYMASIRKHSSAVVVLRMHNIEYQIWHSLSKKETNRIKQIYLEQLTTRLKRFEQEAHKEYDLLIAITEKDANHVLRLEEVDALMVAPFSIDASSVTLNTYKEQWVGYHLGAMDWIPNAEGVHWFLEKVWPKMHKTVPNFEFYFAGRNMPESFKHLNLEGVHCMNEVPSAQDFISDKKILIVPLWTGGGVRVKILEAMAAGKVVITTNVGIKGIDGLAGEHFLVARKPEDFVKSIKWCLDNKEAAQKIADNARELVMRKYEQSTVIRTVIDQVELLLEGRK